MIASGTLLNGRYRLDAEIGRGGMGVIYRAQDTLLQRPVAVKVLAQDGLGSEGRARLLHEAQAAARLNHQNIVTVHDAGETEGQPFVVMELVEGVSLFDRRPATIDESIRIARQICNALEHAHRNGIIHRDLKPENVLVTPDGTAKLMDFGLARSIASRLTHEGAMAGTVFYLAPELALGKPPDGRADLYALGVMLYEFTTGQLPFPGDDPFAVITQHLHAPLVPPRAKNEAIPIALDTLIVRLLSKNPDERPPSAAAVIQMLDEVVLAPSKAQVQAPPELSLLDRIVRGRIVGRESELAEAGKLWERARLGEGQLLLVSGEPGVGKTRLVREVVTRAEVTGGLPLAGECYAEGGAPFAPFAQIARSALRDGLQPLDLPDFVLADLLVLAPDLRLAYPKVPPNPSLDPQSDKARLFENVAAFCQALCQRAPLLLLLEDVHWADSGSLSLLHHLARKTRRLPVLLVATYREVELDQARPLQALLHELNRERLGSQIKLSRLDKASTQAMLKALFAEEISSEFLGAIFHETEGNPFFIEEVCKALVESGKLSFANGRWQRPNISELEIPQSLRVAIQSRVSNLPGEAQEVLTLAAVIGRQFDYDLLAAAGAYDENLLIHALESADRTQLVEETSTDCGGTFRYTHALIPPILREALSGPRRRRYHRQVMGALEALRPDDMESLAYHALESGNLEKGLEYSLQAARKAYQLYALDEALHFTRHALDAAEELDRVDQTLEIYELMGDIHLLRGDFVACVDALQRSLALAGESPRRVGLNSKIGMAYTWIGDEHGLEYLEAAVREADPQTQANELASATAGIGRYHHFHGHHRQALSYLHKAREIAEPLQDVVGLTAIYAYLAGAYQHLTEYPASIDWARRSIDLGERLNAPFAVAIGYEFLAEDALVGRWQEVLQYAEQNRSIGVKIGAMDRIAWSGFAKTQAYYGLGELDKTVEAARSSLELAEATGDIRLELLAQYALGVALADMGDHEAALSAATWAQQRGTQLGQIYMLASGNYALAYVHALHGDWEKAGELMDAVGTALWRTDSRVVPMFYFGLFGLTAFKSGDLEKAERIIGSNLALTRASGSEHFEAEALRVQAQIRSAQGERQQARELFEQSIQIFERLGSRLELGKALYYLGQAQMEWGDMQSGQKSIESSLQTLRACQANHWMAKALNLTA